MAIRMGAWALGFNFYDQSPRSVSVAAAKAIIEVLPKDILCVGLFIEHSLPDIRKISQELNLDLIQCYKKRNFTRADKQKMILPTTLEQPEHPHYFQSIEDYAYILVDAPIHNTGVYGGSGQTANWENISSLKGNPKLILAGGLNSQNVAKAIHRTQPLAVDVATGVEKMPGIKDEIKMKAFFKEVNHANA